MSSEHSPASDRVTVRRGAFRADYDPAIVRAILDDGLIAHVGVTTDRGPIVLPMAYGVDGDTLYLHGALANDLLGQAAGADVCVTVTLVDGLVFARSPFHNSMNYRCVVIRGQARPVTDAAGHERALRIISDHVAANWDDGRAPNEAEVRRTRVVAIPITEASAKIRDGGPIDEPDDIAGPHWGGHVPILTTYAEPVDSADLTSGATPPAAVAALTRRS